jgi:hypothetical protein
MADEGLFCSICRRSSDDFDHILSAPGAAVCDDCLGQLSTFMAEQQPEWGAALVERISTPRKSGHEGLIAQRRD